uniref:Cytosolic protein n=1 Tax=Macrostomum lignano TaxID=282301 RepID=A0A1I8IYG4_9PLAT
MRHCRRRAQRLRLKRRFLHCRRLAAPACRRC